MSDADDDIIRVPRARLREVKDQIDALERERDDLLRQLDDLREEHDNLRAHLTGTIREVAQLREHLARLQGPSS